MGGSGKTAEVSLDGFELHGEVGLQAWKKVAIEDLVNEPAGDKSSTDRGHLLCWVREGIFVDVGSEPWRDGGPVPTDAEGEIFDSAIETVKAIGVFVVVERVALHSKASMREGILERLHLGVFVEVVFFYFAVFVLLQKESVTLRSGIGRGGLKEIHIMERESTYEAHHDARVIGRRQDPKGHRANG